VPRLEVNTDTLLAGGSQQTANGGQLYEAASELQAAMVGVTEAVGDAGAGGALGDWGGMWAGGLAALAEATVRTGGNLTAAGRAYEESDDAQMRG
jgi:hypothetical protein